MFIKPFLRRSMYACMSICPSFGRLIRVAILVSDREHSLALITRPSRPGMCQCNTQRRGISDPPPNYRPYDCNTNTLHAFPSFCSPRGRVLETACKMHVGLSPRRPSRRPRIPRHVTGGPRRRRLGPLATSLSHRWR